MILLWFVLGMLLAFGIARYNESNKLFWQLVVSFALGYTATVMCTRTFGGDERSNDDLTQVGPTQVPVIATNSMLYLFGFADNLASTKVTALDLVSQDYAPVQNEVSVISSEVFGRVRDQPLLTLTQPPECLVKVISTHHETG